MLLYYNWLQDKIASNVPVNEWVQELLGGQRRHVQEPGHQLLPERDGHPEDGRERRPGVHGHAHPVLPVPQPSVRPLDDGRLLRLRRLLLADRPQGDRRPARDDRLQQRRRRGDAPGRRPRDEAEVPRRRRARRGGQGPPRGAGQVAGLAGAIRTSPPTWPTSSGPISSAWASSTRSTTCASATRRRNPELLAELGKQFTDYKYDFKKLVRDICTVADLSARRRSPTTATPATRATSPTPISPHPGRDVPRLHQRR